MAHDVFISYASEDQGAANAICSILESEGIRCWIAPRDILPGMPYAKSIVDAMNVAGVLVIVFSASANRSDHVPKEAELAVQRRIPILPVRLEEVLPSEALGYYLAGQHWLDALAPPLEPSIRRVAEAVRVLLSRTDVGGRRPDASGLSPVAPRPRPAAGAAPGPAADLVEPRSGIELIRVRGGKFEMGDVRGDGQPNERPVRTVEVASFFIGKFPVTQRQWEAVMGFNPSRVQEPERPVTNVSWQDAQEFVAALNGGGPGPFRLPGEAEWEFAARSGGRDERWAGVAGAEVAAVAWTYANSGARTHPVGQKRPNGLGLFDMSGNVWEWCSDRYREVPGSDGPETDTGAPEADIRVYRGGSWINPPGDARCSYRGNGPATGRASNVGFRLARSID